MGKHLKVHERISRAFGRAGAPCRNAPVHGRVTSITSAAQFEETRRGEENGDQEEKCCEESSKDLRQDERRSQKRVCEGCNEAGQEGHSAQIVRTAPSQGPGLAMVGGRDRSRNPLRRHLRGRDRRGASRADACRQSEAERRRRRSLGGGAGCGACGRQAAREGRRTRPPARRTDHDQRECRLRRPSELQRRAGEQRRIRPWCAT
ncbi:hypothetical protein ABIA99_004410 [Bradyrhizobium sp. LB12.1]